MRMALMIFYNLLNDIRLPWMENIIVPMLIVWTGDDKNFSWYENIFYVMVS